MAKEGFAFFDVDHTIIAGSTGKHLAFRCVRKGFLPLRQLLKIPLLYFHYRTGMLEPEILEELLHQLAGLPIDEIRRMAVEIFDQKIKPRLYLQSLQLIEAERFKGRTVVLATSAPESIVVPLAEFIGVENVVATRFAVQDGVLTGSFEGPPAFGEGKLRKVTEFADSNKTDLACCSFYTDSHYDIPLLQKVSDPVAVNPDRYLRRLAGERGWKILKFKKVLGKTGVL